MFIPLHDANRLKHIRLQYVTLGLIAANVICYLMTLTASGPTVEAAVVGLGFIPSVAFSLAELPPQYVIVPGGATYVTYAFLHADIWHLGGNMLFLWVFGDNVEDALGHLRYGLFYVLCAAAGALLHGLIAPTSQVPLIGASGAVAGLVAAYLILHPRVTLWVLAFGRIPMRVPAWLALALWILFQFLMLAAMGQEEVSWAAHIGGILAGGALVMVLRRRDVPLFDRQIVRPEAAKVEPAPTSRAPAATGPWGRR